MGRKFMIVKPKFCCGDCSRIGEVFESTQKTSSISFCQVCANEIQTSSGTFYKRNGEDWFIQESRIVWLPDEQDVIAHDESQELTA